MSQLDLRSILRRPVITEKSTAGIERQNKYIFEVDPGANKLEIKKAVEELFSVKVTKVNTQRRFGKHKRMGMTSGYTGSFKEAIITLKAGDKIDIY